MKQVVAAALALHESDNVATALRPIAAGERICVRHGERLFAVTVGDAIALCHKFAILPIAKDATVHKYGESIGRAVHDIEIGAHVHVHNLVSKRAN